MIYLIQAARYLFEAVFCYMIFTKEHSYNNCVNDASFKKQNLKNAIYFCLTYFSIVFSFYILFDHPLIRLVSTLLLFFYFGWKNKKVAVLKYILTFSIFISVLIECSYLISYSLFYHGIQLFFKSPHRTVYTVIDKNLILFMSLINTLHFCFVLVIYKANFIKMKTIKALSIYKRVPISFFVCLLTIIYLKHIAQQTSSENAWITTMLCNTLLFILPVFLIFYQLISKYAELKNRDKNHNINNFFFQWVLHPPSKTKFIVNAGGDTLSFLDKYEYITSGFIKRLNAM